MATTASTLTPPPASMVRPIAMDSGMPSSKAPTAIAVPLALAGDKPGSELQSPMAIVILGGLITATFLNLVVVPNREAWKLQDIELLGEQRLR